MNRFLRKFGSLWSRRRAIRAVKIAAVAVGVLLALEMILLPVIVRRAVAFALTALGQPEAQFEIGGVSFWNTHLVDLRLGAGRTTRVGGISVTYSPASLLRGRVETIRITGAEVVIGITPEGLDLSAILPPSAPVSGSSSGGGSAQDSRRDLPFDRVEFRSSILTVAWEGRSIWVPLDGTVERKAGAGLSARLLARVQGGSVHIQASRHSGGKLEVGAETDGIDIGALIAAVPSRLAMRVPVVGRGLVSFKAHYIQSPDGRSATVWTGGDRLDLAALHEGHYLAAEQVGWALEAELDQALRVSRMNGSIGAGRLVADGEEIRDVSVALRSGSDRQLIASVSASGEDWRLRGLRISALGLLEPAQRQAYDFEASFAADAFQSDRLAEWGALRITGLGALSLEGKATARVGAPAGPGRPRPWSAAITNARLSIVSGDLLLPARNLSVLGLNGQLHLTADVDAAGMRARLLPASELSVQWIDPGSELRLTQADFALPVAQLSWAEGGASGAISWRGDWKITLERASLRLAETGISGLPGGLGLERAAGTVVLGGRADTNSLEVLALAGSRLSAATVRAGDANPAVRTGTLTLDLATEPAVRLLKLTRSDTGTRAELGLNARLAKALDLAGDGWTARVENSTLQTLMTVAPDRPASTELLLSLQNGSLKYPEAQLAAAGISASIPLRWNAAAARPGEVRIDSIVYEGEKRPPLSGTAALLDNRLDFGLSWPVLEGASLNAAGALDLGSGAPSGQIHAAIPPFDLQDKQLIASLVPVLRGYEITGRLGLDVELKLLSGRVLPDIRLAVAGGRMVSQESDWTFEGVEGSVSIDSLNPLSTRPGQKIQVRQATLGKLQLARGVSTFRIENPNLILVEGMEFDWAGGRLYTNSFRLNRAVPRMDAVISADRLNLAQVLPLVLDSVSGEGTLYGRLPVQLRWPQKVPGQPETVRWSEPQLAFGEGFLYATPGGGRLRVKNPEVLLGDVLAQQDPRFKPDGALAGVRTNLMQALRDLDYSVLKVDFLKEEATLEDDDLMARVFVQGRGHSGPNPQEIGGFTVNVRGFGELLKRAIGYGGKLSFGR